MKDERYLQRKIRNRKSAEQSRNRRKAYIQELEHQLASLKQQQTSLELENVAIQAAIEAVPPPTFYSVFDDEAIEELGELDILLFNKDIL